MGELRRRIGRVDGVTVEPGGGGLPRINVSAAQGEAQIYLHGAHVTAFRPRGQEPVLFMSAKSLFAPGKPIRGGVPICFPWFGAWTGPGTWPQHGFARLRPWTLESAELAGDGTVVLTLALQSDAQTRQSWPHDFSARYRVLVGQTLRLRLEVTNTGPAPVRYEDALHTYFAVGDVRQVAVTGLEQTEYLDKAAGANGAQKRQAGPLRFEGEVDRVYLDTTATCVIDDPLGGRRIRVAKSGSRATVAWNPHIAKAKAMADFGDDEWPSMVCIETANAGQYAIDLPPGQTHATETIIAVEPTAATL